MEADRPPSASPSAAPADEPDTPEVETAQGHTGSDHVSHGANSNLTPALAQTDEDARAAETVEQQHQHEGS